MSTTDIVLSRWEIPGADMFRRRGWWEGRLTVDFVDDHALRTPQKVALVDSRGTLTYGEVRERTRNLAAAMLELGLQPGDVVAAQAPNWAELVLAHLALDRVGMIFLPLHDGFREHETRHLLALSKAKAIIYPPSFRGFDHRALLAHVQPALPKLHHHVVLRAEPEGDEHGFDTLAGDGGWEARHGPDFLERHRPSSADPLEIMVSSGTTALPRCSLYCDDAMLHLIRHQYGQDCCNLSEHDVAVSIAPAGTGATGYIFPIVAPLLFGAKSVLLERWDGNNPGLALDLMVEHAATYAVLIPTQLVKLVAAQRERPRHIPSLRFISNAGAKLADSVAEETEQLFSCVVQTVYGATDGGVPVMTSVDDPTQKRRTAGKLLEGQEMRLLRDDGTDAVAGEPGEVVWRGANVGFGYLNDPEGTAAVWDEEGWYHSGDMGLLDADGYLSIVGRKKDMIIRGGRNINPRAIEEVLLRHPSVLDAAIVPVPDATLGEIVGAVIVPVAGATPMLAELKQFLLDQGMAVWYQPERLLLLDDLPRNAGAKIDKHKLVQHFISA